ncbi:hypothetical protein EV401DRAFT_456185 [Pisolithus croceorrhizus]|nr:hypothetical protein EV401DRAFT_456185 [Pisolithus croceorrhizus]
MLCPFDEGGLAINIILFSFPFVLSLSLVCRLAKTKKFARSRGYVPGGMTRAKTTPPLHSSAHMLIEFRGHDLVDCEERQNWTYYNVVYA